MISEQKKQLILKAIADARNDKMDEDFVCDLFAMDKAEDKNLDVHLIRAMGDMARFGFPFPSFVESTWRWKCTAIAEGFYPLEKLPEHVRDLAKALYYGQKPEAQKTAK
jgi:hypothetical protein